MTTHAPSVLPTAVPPPSARVRAGAAVPPRSVHVPAEVRS